MLEFVDSGLYFVQDENNFKYLLLQVGSGSNEKRTGSGGPKINGSGSSSLLFPSFYTPGSGSTSLLVRRDNTKLIALSLVVCSHNMNENGDKKKSSRKEKNK